VKELTSAVHRLEGRAEKLARRVRRLARKARNRARPPVIDLQLRPVEAMADQPNRIGSVGHYTAGVDAEDDEQAVRLWRGVDAQHKAQSWSMIGYHIGLGPDGGIYLLRPIGKVGAHTAGANTGRTGFSVHGTTGDTWTKPQLRALRYALKKYGLQDLPVWGHNDLNATACPGAFKPGYTSKGRNA
jgi:hypothetical protein